MGARSFAQQTRFSTHNIFIYIISKLRVSHVEQWVHTEACILFKCAHIIIFSSSFITLQAFGDLCTPYTNKIVLESIVRTGIHAHSLFCRCLTSAACYRRDCAIVLSPFDSIFNFHSCSLNRRFVCLRL